ncbi:MAG: hypothetical protein Q8R92_02435 [Deltaproteobacteria bacterium]|nr:hypothetical protein [Deltaproteobacteria bacterium]
MSALIAVAMVFSLAVAAAPPAFAEDTDTVASEWRDRSPLTSSLLYPLSLTAFFADLPIWLLAREQPFTYGMTEMELVDGYNPVTDSYTHDALKPHDMDVTAGY